jgi:hypothetical protein
MNDFGCDFVLGASAGRGWREPPIAVLRSTTADRQLLVWALTCHPRPGPAGRGQLGAHRRLPESTASCVCDRSDSIVESQVPGTKQSLMRPSCRLLQTIGLEGTAVIRSRGNCSRCQLQVEGLPLNASDWPSGSAAWLRAQAWTWPIQL